MNPFLPNPDAHCVRRRGDTYYRKGDLWILREGSRSVSAKEQKRLKAEYQATWRNLQRVWKAFGGGLNELFTIRTGRQLGYHKFLSLNLDPPVVTLTEEQANAGATLAGPYWVSQGRMQPAVDVRIEERMFVSNLRPEEVKSGEEVYFVSLRQMPGEWVSGSVVKLDLIHSALHNGCIAMPWSEGQWGTFVRVRQQRDKNLEVTTQRLVGQMNTEK